MNQDRLERIRLLSSRFHELQGLRVALAGATLAVVMAGYLVVAPRPTDMGAMIALAVSLVPMIPGVWWLNRYYAATFGRQVSKPRNPWAVQAFLFAYFVVGWSLNASIPAIPAGAPTVATVAVVSVWIAIRDWPWRAYYLGAPAAVAIAFTASASGGGVLDPHLTLATLFLALGASLVPIGVLDHRLLVRLTEQARELEVAR